MTFSDEAVIAAQSEYRSPCHCVTFYRGYSWFWKCEEIQAYLVKRLVEKGKFLSVKFEKFWDVKSNGEKFVAVAA